MIRTANVFINGNQRKLLIPRLLHAALSHDLRRQYQHFVHFETFLTVPDTGDELYVLLVFKTYLTQHFVRNKTT